METSEVAALRLSRDSGATDGVVFSTSKVHRYSAPSRVSIEEVVRSASVQEFVTALWNNSMEGVVVADLSGDAGRILYFNAVAERAFGYRSEDVLGYTLPKLFPKGMLDEFVNSDKVSLELPQVVQGIRRSGSPLPLQVKFTRMYALDRELWVIYFRDMSEIHQQRQEIERLAHVDMLTGLPNRNLLQERLTQLLAQSRRYKRIFAFLYIDLDKFKHINDTQGHPVGDRVLKELGKRFKGCVRDTDTVARLGGDEFAALLSDLQREEDVRIVAERFLKMSREPIVINNSTFQLDASIGVALYPKDGDDMESIMKNADAAMYHVKKRIGGGHMAFYSEELNDAVEKKAVIERGLKKAISEGGLVLHYQPQVDMTTGELVGAEALLRWQDGDRLVPPLDFIPVAEETGLIIQMGEWALREACEEAMRWRRMGLGGNAGIRIGVNLSVRQFNDMLPQMVFTILQETGLPPSLLDLEITESFLASDQRATSILKSLEMGGVHLSVDDFGTGYSCLQYLKDLPLHTIKIDRSFVRDLGDVGAEKTTAIVETIITLSKRLGHTTVAEGVETEEQAAALRGMGCETCQGYMYSKPLPADQFLVFARGREGKV